MPGRDESPFMTWGQLEGTPQRALTPGATANKTPLVAHNVAHAPSFHMGESKHRQMLTVRVYLIDSFTLLLILHIK